MQKKKRKQIIYEENKDYRSDDRHHQALNDFIIRLMLTCQSTKKTFAISNRSKSRTPFPEMHFSEAETTGLAFNLAYIKIQVKI